MPQLLFTIFISTTLVIAQLPSRNLSPTHPTESFTYDPVGNRNSLTHIYNSANRLLDDGTFTYTYDANGNMISKQNKTTLATTTFTYDPENQLTRIDFPGGGFAEYKYDGLGRRIQKNVNGTLTKYIYDNEDILLEYDGANTLRARWTHGPGIDEPLIMERDLDLNGTLETQVFYLQDGLGSVTALVNSSGTILERYEYDSFGNLTIKDSLGNILPQSSFGNFYTYTGREYDPESGLYYYRRRYYDPLRGSFIQEDPVAGGVLNPQSLNKYPYVQNNPINRIDPTGEISIGGAVVIIGFILFAIALTRFGCELVQTPRILEEAAFEGIRNDPEQAEEIALILFKKPLRELTREEMIEVGKRTPEFGKAVAKRLGRLIERGVDLETSSVPTPTK